MTAAEIAAVVGGTAGGAFDTTVGGIAPLERARPDRTISFFANSKYSAQFARSGAGVTLVAPDLASLPGPAVRVLVKSPHDAMLTLIPRFYVAPQREPGWDPTARIGGTGYDWLRIDAIDPWLVAR